MCSKKMGLLLKMNTILRQETYCSQSVARKSSLTRVYEIKEDGGGHILQLLQHILCRGKSRHL